MAKDNDPPDFGDVELGAGFGGGPPFGKPLTPEERRKIKLSTARYQYLQLVTHTAQALAIKHPDLQIEICVNRAVELANKLNTLTIPDVLRIDGDV